jgi:hypothetical protein
MNLLDSSRDKTLNTQKLEARTHWRAACRNLRSMEQTILRLARHTTATPEQKEAGNVAYQEVYLSMLRTQAQLRKQFPARNSWGFNWEVPDELA